MKALSSLRGRLSLLLVAPLTFAAPPATARPEEVVAAIVKALGNSNAPAPNAGIYTAYQLASPANHAVTGPYGRFLRMLRNPEFSALLHPDRDPGAVRFEPLALDDSHAQQSVHIRSRGEWHGYKFFLTRQSGNVFQGAWMIDGVVPVVDSGTQPAANAPSDSSATN